MKPTELITSLAVAKYTLIYIIIIVLHLNCVFFVNIILTRQWDFANAEILNTSPSSEWMANASISGYIAFQSLYDGKLISSTQLVKTKFFGLYTYTTI